MTNPRKKKKPDSDQRFVRKKKKSGDVSPYGRARRAPARMERSGDALEFPVRLNRFIARAGVCSRREADDLIARGIVAIDGTIVTVLGTKIDRKQTVTVSGKRITPAGHAYILLNKPTDTITTSSDEKGRRTVLDLIAREDLKDLGLFSVGRLDRHTRGVLLITNDGKLAHRLMHPSFETEKIYRVKTSTLVTDTDLDLLRSGVTLDDGLARADKIDRLEDVDGYEVGISIHEGRNRQIRRMFEKLGHEVMRLERVRYAGLTTTGVRAGKWRFLKEKEVLQLYKLVDL